MATMTNRPNIMTSKPCVTLPLEVKRHTTQGKDVAPSKSAVEMRHGYRTLYLGSIPTTDIASTETSVSLLLDRFRLGSINDEDIFLDTKICGLIMYFVDNKDKIVKTKIFDLSRISFCSGDHVIDPCVFAWVYHQETREGFRHECHAVKASSEKKARYLAVLLNNAFTQLYHEVQAALSSSRLFHQAKCDKDKPKCIKDKNTDMELLSNNNHKVSEKGENTPSSENNQAINQTKDTEVKETKVPKKQTSQGCTNEAFTQDVLSEEEEETIEST